MKCVNRRPPVIFDFVMLKVHEKYRQNCIERILDNFMIILVFKLVLLQTKLAWLQNSCWPRVNRHRKQLGKLPVNILMMLDNTVVTPPSPRMACSSWRPSRTFSPETSLGRGLLSPSRWCPPCCTISTTTMTPIPSEVNRKLHSKGNFMQFTFYFLQ